MAWNHINGGFVQRYCKVEGCIRKYCARGYCKHHWALWRKHGFIPSFNYRNPNKVIVKGDVAEIIIYKGVTGEFLTTSIIDAEDAPRVAQYKWHLAGGYIKNNRWPLAGFIMHGSKWVDHINGNRLDNRKSNLRVVNESQNAQNMGVQKRKKSSRYKGVCWEGVLPDRGWIAKIKTGDKAFNLGRYSTEKEAAWVYDQFALEMFGEYARTNFHYETPKDGLGQTY